VGVSTSISSAKAKGGQGCPAELLIQALREPDAYDHPVDDVELVETHISWVLLAGEYAYKIKKPVSLPFVDFGTLERRRKFCDEELRLNRRLAPSIYVEVIPIGGTAQEPVLGGEPAIEYAVKMRRFPSGARVDRQLRTGAVTADDLRKFAVAVAQFHASLEPAPGDTRLGSAAIVIRNALNNLRDLEHAVSDADLDAVTELREWTESQCLRLDEAFSRRKRSGMIREGHGDLHLENLVYLDGEITAFDALEFDPELRWMDVMNETAFLVMDLVAHDRPDLAYEFLNRYLEISGDYAGLEVFEFYLAYRALIRAKVMEIRDQQREGSGGGNGADKIPYLTHAMRMIARDPPPLLMITHGLSGSGKTTVTDLLIGGLHAVRIRSDLERKRLHGFAADADTESGVGQDLYEPQATAETYAALEHYAALGLGIGLNVIVDAAFLHRAERAALRNLAARRNARFVVLDCTCPEAQLRERIARRRAMRADASEATADVLDYQLRHEEPLDAAELPSVVRIDTSGRLDRAALVALIARAL
jgi:hypothetical protein